MAKRRLGYATVAILRAIDEDHAYGLDIIGSTGLATGTVYVTLGRLQKRGFVATSWEDQRIADREGRPRRRYYRLTKKRPHRTAGGAGKLRRPHRRHRGGNATLSEKRDAAAKATSQGAERVPRTSPRPSLAIRSGSAARRQPRGTETVASPLLDEWIAELWVLENGAPIDGRSLRR